MLSPLTTKKSLMPMKPYENFSLENMDGEVWKDVTICNALPYYQVSNLGRVKIKARSYVDSMGRNMRINERILRQTTNRQGYKLNSIYSKERQYNMWTHRIVATEFIPNHQNKPFINHKDGIKNNNHVDNLEWCTAKENIRHSIAMGLQLPMIGETNGMSKLTNVQVLEIFNCNLPAKEIADKYKTKLNNIHRIKRGELWSGITGKKYERVEILPRHVKKIFKSTLSIQELAKKYKVNERTIDNIKVGRQGSHITGLYYPTKHRIKTKFIVFEDSEDIIIHHFSHIFHENHMEP